MIKILSVEIENYGNIVGGKKIDFRLDLQQFCEANGYGKTTLCAFIRTAFYGMKSRRENDTAFGDREHYYPFSGGRFGGAINFTRGEKTCRIERFFDEKSATRDTFKYFESGVRLDADADKIGKSIFGMDEEAFCRCITFDSRETSICASDGIKERLYAIAKSVPDELNAAEAIAVLEKRRKEIGSDRKGNGSEIAKLDKARKTLSEEIVVLENTARSADELYKAHTVLKSRIEGVEKEITELSDYAAREEQRERYEELENQAKEAEYRCREILSKYPSGIVSESETERLSKAQKRLIELSAQLSALQASNTKRERFGLLSSAFQSGVPMKETLVKVGEEIAKSERLAAEIQAETARACNGNDVGLGRNGDLGRKSENNRASRFYGVAAVLVALALLFLAAGFMLGKKFDFFALFIASCGVAAILIVLAVAIVLKKAQQGEENSGLKGESTQKVDKNSGVEGEIFGFNQTDAEEKISRATSEKRLVDERLESFFCRFRLHSGTFSERRGYLLMNIRQYEELRNEMEEFELRRREVQASMGEATREIEEIFTARRLSVPSDWNTELSRAISRFEIDRANAADLSEKRLRYQKRAEEYLKSCNAKGNVSCDTKAFAAQTVSAENVRGKISELRAAADEGRRALAANERDIEEAENAAVLLEEKLSALEENREKTNEAAFRRKIYVKTAELLQRADDELLKRYSDPVRNRFLKYAELLERELGVEAYMNRDFSLSFSRGGARRKDLHLSTGVRSVCAFCLRLALVDEMFSGGDVPFMILDDPFVHLDETHFEKTAELLRILAGQRQIIYFTCHNSRVIS